MPFTFVVALATTPIQSPAPPPAPSHAQLMQLRSAKDVIAVSKLKNGKKAPSDMSVPELLNQKEVRDFIRRKYPESARADTAKHDMGWVWMFVNEKGEVANVRLVHSTRSAVLDSFMLRVVTQATFAAARVGKDKVGVWMPYPVEIPRYGSWSREEGLADGPVFTPYTVKPEVLNRQDIQVALVRNYPPNLRDRGIGGTALVWLLISADGETRNVRLKETSGYDELDAAAIEVARVIRFSPARNRDVPVTVWIALPIVFRTK